MTLFVAPIVEGETEERCIKHILSRVWNELLGIGDREHLLVLQPIPASRSSLIKDGHPNLSQTVQRAVRVLQANIRRSEKDRGLVLLLIDADEDCPATLVLRPA